MLTAQSYREPSAFIPSLEGLRAVAAFGIMLTHVAFQTGLRPDSILARFDFFVPVFFALSAFLLWRRYQGTRQWGSYLWHRALRILPAYWLTVSCVFLLLPDAFGTRAQAIIANVFLAQIYVPEALAPGLTHLWSLCVEVAFYLVLPLIALALRGLNRRKRIVVIVAACLLSLGWPFLPFVAATPAPGVANLQIFPVSYLCWFGIGLIAAELEGRVRLPGLVWAYWALALVVAWVAAQPWFGPVGLVHPSPWEFLRRILAGTLFGALFLLPVAWGSVPELATRPMRLLGSWSYGIFLWHVPMLAWTFPLLGVLPFSGHFFPVLLLTTALTVPVAAASYYFVEEPVARWGRGRNAAARPTQQARVTNH